MDPFRTRHKDDYVCKWGGWFAPPTPRLSFQAVQACCQEHRTMNKTCIKHKTVLELFKAHPNGVLFAKRGCVIVLYYLMLEYVILYYTMVF